MNKRFIILLLLVSCFTSCPREDFNGCSTDECKRATRNIAIYSWWQTVSWSCRLDSDSFSGRSLSTLPAGDWKKLLRLSTTDSPLFAFGTVAGRPRLLMTKNLGSNWEEIVLPSDRNFVNAIALGDTLALLSTEPNARLFELGPSSEYKFSNEVTGIPNGNWTDIFPISQFESQNRRYLIYENSKNRMVEVNANLNRARTVPLPKDFSIGRVMFYDLTSVIFPTQESPSQVLVELRPTSSIGLEVVLHRNPAPKRAWIGGSLSFSREVLIDSGKSNNVLSGYSPPREGVLERPGIFSSLDSMDLSAAFAFFADPFFEARASVPMFVVAPNISNPIRALYRTGLSPNPNLEWENPTQSFGIQDFPLRNWVDGIAFSNSRSDYLVLLSKGETSSLLTLPLNCR